MNHIWEVHNDVSSYLFDSQKAAEAFKNQQPATVNMQLTQRKVMVTKVSSDLVAEVVQRALEYYATAYGDLTLTSSVIARAVAGSLDENERSAKAIALADTLGYCWTGSGWLKATSLAAANPGWCKGCTPESCGGCATPAQDERKAFEAFSDWWEQRRPPTTDAHTQAFAAWKASAAMATTLADEREALANELREMAEEAYSLNEAARRVLDRAADALANVPETPPVGYVAAEIYAAWRKVGADVCGLKWDAFVDALRASQERKTTAATELENKLAKALDFLPEPGCDLPQLPEPHSKVNGKLGTYCSFESTQARRGDAVYTADQMDAHYAKGYAAGQATTPAPAPEDRKSDVKGAVAIAMAYATGEAPAWAATPAPAKPVCQTCRAFSMLTAK